VSTIPVDIFSRYPASTFLKGRLTAKVQISGEKNRLSDLYAALAGLEERDFGTKLDKDPYAMLWEMMVARLLRESAFDLLPRKSKGPDFIAVVNGKTIAVEAVCPGLGDIHKLDSVPELRPNRGMRPVPTQKILLRIASALTAKKRAFDLYRADGTIPSDAACVVAISSQKIGRARAMHPCAGLTATLGHGGAYAVFDSRTSQCIREGFELQERVIKANNSSVSTLPFLDDAYASISGILYSDTSALGLPYDLIGDAHFIHNPKATQAIAPGTFHVGHEYWTFYCADSTRWSTRKISHSMRSELQEG
jgi:hypothetical protein